MLTGIMKFFFMTSVSEIWATLRPLRRGFILCCRVAQVLRILPILLPNVWFVHSLAQLLLLLINMFPHLKYTWPRLLLLADQIDNEWVWHSSGFALRSPLFAIHDLCFGIPVTDFLTWGQFFCSSKYGQFSFASSFPFLIGAITVCFFPLSSPLRPSFPWYFNF